MAPTYPAGPPPRKITSNEAMEQKVGGGKWGLGSGLKGRSLPTPTPHSPLLIDQHERVLHQPAEDLEELRAHRAVDDAVIAAHREPHALAHHRLAVDDHQLVLARADGDDARLRRVDD